MDGVIPPIPEDRPLHAHERALAEWMLAHGGADASDFLPQLTVARVVSRCGCGCPSIDFAVEGRPLPSGPLRILGDYVIGEPPAAGIMIFEQSGVLGGIEVYTLAGDMPDTLPTPADLRPFESASGRQAES